MERSFTFLDMVLSECGREGERGRERGVHHCMAQTQSLRATLILTLEPSHTHICIHNKSIARMFATIRCDVHSFVSTARNRCRPARDQRTANRVDERQLCQTLFSLSIGQLCACASTIVPNNVVVARLHIICVALCMRWVDGWMS